MMDDFFSGPERESKDLVDEWQRDGKVKFRGFGDQ